MTRLHTNTLPIDFTVWLWGLSVKSIPPSTRAPGESLGADRSAGVGQRERELTGQCMGPREGPGRRVVND